MKKYILLFLTINASIFASAQQQLPNSSFENWTTNGFLPFEEPDTWFGTSVVCDATPPNNVCDPSNIKTTDAHAGTYAVKMVNLASPQDGSISEGQLIYSPSSENYVSFKDKPKSLTGYYKFNKTGSDFITIAATILGTTSTDIVAYGTLDLTDSKTNYTLFTVPLQYFSKSITPKDIYVIINFNENASINSSFTVDNLAFTYVSTPTSTVTPVSAEIKFFPNPGKDMIHFEKMVRNISIQSANGTSVLRYYGDINELNIHSLEKGMYIISYEYNELLIYGKLIVE